MGTTVAPSRAASYHLCGFLEWIHHRCSPTLTVLQSWHDAFYLQPLSLPAWIFLWPVMKPFQDDLNYHWWKKSPASLKYPKALKHLCTFFSESFTCLVSYNRFITILRTLFYKHSFHPKTFISCFSLNGYKNHLEGIFFLGYADSRAHSLEMFQ